MAEWNGCVADSHQRSLSTAPKNAVEIVRGLGIFSGMANSHDPAGPAVLLATADELLMDDLLRLAAAAGVNPQIESDLIGVRRSWQSATLVVVGHDLAAAVARAQPVRRPGVVVVGTDLDDPSIYQCAVAIGGEQVLMLPDEEPALSDKLADCVDGSVATAVTLACVGGRGGAGASTLAGGLAVTAARRGLRTILVDGDPLGGGIDLLLGAEHGDGLRWPDLAGVAGRVSSTALRSALPVVDHLAVLSWDRSDVVTIPPEAMRAVLGAAQRCSDLVVVDLPRRCDEAVEEALVRATATLLVVPRDVRSVAAAGRVIGHIGLVATDLRVVARDPALSDLTAADVAAMLGHRLAGHLRFDKDLPRSVENRQFRVEPRRPLGRAAGELLDCFGLDGKGAA